MTFFLPTARAQAYYPRYGGNTGSAFEALLESGAVQQRQMNGAVAYGWIPTLDLQMTDNPRFANARTKYCLKVMKDNGITFDSGNAEGIALNACAEFYFLKAALDRTPRHITPATFRQVVEGIGSAYVTPAGLGLRFRPGRHDGAEKAYFLKYFADCGCFRYYGALRTIP
jgi:hypothetical protein